MSGYQYAAGYDPEMGYGKPLYEGGYADFMDEQVRKGFIRKVFGILSVQLLVTFASAIIFSNIAPARLYIEQNSWPLFLSVGLTFGSLIALSCCGDLHRRFPHNYALLTVFTLSESFLVGAATCHFNTSTVLLAVAITATITIGLSLFALQTKYDFSTGGAILFSGLLCLLTFAILAAFIQSQVLTLLYSAGGAFLFSCYLVYDIQILMSGKKVQLSPDEYVFAAINLYLDIINIFIYILSLLNQR